MVAWTKETLTFWCQKGKQLGNRAGFFWCAPRRTLAGLDLLPPLQNQLKGMCKIMRHENFAFHPLAFDLGKGRPFDIQGFIVVLRQLLEPFWCRMWTRFPATLCGGCLPPRWLWLSLPR